MNLIIVILSAADGKTASQKVGPRGT